MHSFFLRCLKNGFLKKPLPACIRYNRSVHSGHMYGSRLSFLFDAATAEISTTLPSSAGSRTYALSIRNSPRFCGFSPHMQGLLWQMQTTLDPPLAQGSSSVLAVLVFGSTPSMRGLFVYLLPIERPLPMQGKSRPNWASFFLTLEPTLRKQRKGVIRRKRHLFLRANPAYGEFRTQQIV